jgi:hypothetical protein
MPQVEQSRGQNIFSATSRSEEKKRRLEKPAPEGLPAALSLHL